MCAQTQYKPVKHLLVESGEWIKKKKKKPDLGTLCAQWLFSLKRVIHFGRIGESGAAIARLGANCFPFVRRRRRCVLSLDAAAAAAS